MRMSRRFAVRRRPDVPAVGDSPVMVATSNIKIVSGSTYTALPYTYTVPKTGNYRFKWTMVTNNLLGTVRTRLYKNGTAVGTEKSTNSVVPVEQSEDIACTAGDQITVQGRGATFANCIFGGFGAHIDWEKTLPTPVLPGNMAVNAPATNLTLGINTTMSESLLSLTVDVAGTYRFKWTIQGQTDSGTWQAQLYKNGVAVGSLWSVTSSTAPVNCAEDVTCAAGDALTVWAKGISITNACVIAGFCACIDWNTGY